MHVWDWLFVAVPLLLSLGIALYTRQYVRSVASFMAGGRNAGRFLISTARSEQGSGAVVYVSHFQLFMVAGFTVTWWNQLSVPVSLLLAISGFVIYRYRQTRAMTLAQFFEMRYSRAFRLATGVLAFVAGIVNFGVIPVIGARFVVYFLELPATVTLLGYECGTHLVLMAGFLSTCVLMTTAGGQVTVLITDCAEGMMSQILYVFVAISLLIVFFRWPTMKAALLATPPGQSLVNPFDSGGLKNFNAWYVVMSICISAYSTMAWQNSHAFNSSAHSPHESRMGVILGRWRAFASAVMVTILSVCAMAFLKTPAGQSAVEASLQGVTDPAIRSQMQVPVALSHLLPVGVKGAFLAICVMGIIAGDGIHLHSWGSILVQDVILPYRKKPLSTRGHLMLLRAAIVLVALWAFAFGALFSQMEYVLLWWAVTQAIFTGGAGAAIIGGLYWSRGTSAGAWSALAVGSVFSVTGIALDTYFNKVLHQSFPLNGVQISFAATLLAIGVYVAVSWLTCRTPHDMDRLLNRSPVPPDTAVQRNPASYPGASLIHRIVGIDAQFSRSDRWIAIGIFAWSMIWVAIFIVGSLGHVILSARGNAWSNSAWADYWLWVAIYLPLAIGVVTTIWFTIGCALDMRAFFRRLRLESVDVTDDGTVTKPQ